VPDQEIDPRITLIEKAWATKEARPHLERSLKIAFPNADIPGLALREATEATEAKLAEREASIDAKLAKFEADRDHERAINDLAKQGYKADDIKAIEDIMAKEGIGLHSNAAIVYDTRRQVAAPRTPSVEPRGSMSPKAYGRGAHAAYFNGIMEGEFHHPGEDWARDKVDMILEDFKHNRAEAEVKWADPSYWPASPNFPVKA
jgi:hypothetical protein